jgi:hypothetical protein
MYQLRSRELGVKNAHLQFPHTRANRSCNPVPVQAPYPWFPSRSIVYGVGVRAKKTRRGVWGLVEPKVSTYPWNVVAGGVARICVSIRASADVTTVCVTCTSVKKVWVVEWSAPRMSVGHFGARRSRVGGMCAARPFQRSVANAKLLPKRIRSGYLQV